MQLLILCFIGIIVGSICTKIGMRFPRGKKIFEKSICSHCGVKYSYVSFFSYFISSGRCKNCGARLRFLPVLNEAFTGLFFALSYYVFGISYSFFIAIGIVCLLMIILISDLNYMIIPDEVLIVFSAYFIILLFLKIGLEATLLQIGYGIFLFLVMYLIMFLGEVIFKRESLGGGDVKMMFIFGLILGPLAGIFSIFVASFIALPVSIIIMIKNDKNIIPFGPFLLIALMLFFFLEIDADFIINLLRF